MCVHLCSGQRGESRPAVRSPLLLCTLKGSAVISCFCSCHTSKGRQWRQHTLTHIWTVQRVFRREVSCSLPANVKQRFLTVNSVPVRRYSAGSALSSQEQVCKYSALQGRLHVCSLSLHLELIGSLLMFTLRELATFRFSHFWREAENGMQPHQLCNTACAWERIEVWMFFIGVIH